VYFWAGQLSWISDRPFEVRSVVDWSGPTRSQRKGRR
jgi:hypothetical protein